MSKWAAWLGGALISIIAVGGLAVATAEAGVFGKATLITNPPSTLFTGDTGLNSPPFSDAWVSYALGIATDDGAKISAIEVTLSGQFHQRWAYDAETEMSEPSPSSVNIGNGDSHLIPGSLTFIAPTENNNVAGQPQSLPDTSTRDYGVGTSMTGLFGYDSAHQAAQIPGQPVNFAYIVIPRGSESTTAISVNVASNTSGGIPAPGRTLTNTDFGGTFCPVSGCPNARLDVLGNGILIPDDDTTPNIVDSTAFGSVPQSSPQQRTFMIRNTSGSLLTLEEPSLTGPFSLIGAFPSTIESMSSFPFTLGLDTSTPGTFAGSVSFETNDLERNPYDFSLEGTIISPGIDVRGNDISIPDNDSTPRTQDNTNFGTVPLNLPWQRTFTIHNISESPLAVGTPTFTGPFSLDGTFPSSVDPLSSAPFTLSLDTSTPGNFFGSISFANSDLNKSPYNFLLYSTVDSFEFPPDGVIPEPSTITLLVMAFAGSVGCARRKQG